MSLVDENRQWFKSHYGLKARETPRDFAFCAHAILQDQIFEIKNSSNDKRFHDNHLVTGEPNVIFYAGISLNINGNKLGTLCVIDNKPNALTENALEALTALGRQVESQLILRLSNKKLQEANERLLILSSTDTLTGLPNRRTLFDVFEKEFRRSMREHLPISIILLDIDCFKKYNDNYGHVEGDKCLKNISKSLRNVLDRPGDLVGRYGGEEFMFILPNTGKSGAEHIAKLTLEKIRNLKIENTHSTCSPYVSISLGVSYTNSEEIVAPNVLIEQADQALYQAKLSGRNQYKIYQKKRCY